MVGPGGGIWLTRVRYIHDVDSAYLLNRIDECFARPLDCGTG